MDRLRRTANGKHRGFIYATIPATRRRLRDNGSEMEDALKVPVLVMDICCIHRTTAHE